MTNVPSKSEFRAPTLPAASPRRDATLPLMFGLFCLGVLMLGLGMFLYPTGRSASDAPSAISIQKESATLPGELRQWLAQPSSKGKSQPVAGEMRQPRPLQQPTATTEGVDLERLGDAGQPLISGIGVPLRSPLPAQPPLIRQTASKVSPAAARPTPSWTEADLLEQLRRMPTFSMTRDAMRQGVAAALKEKTAMTAPHPEAALLAAVKYQPMLAQLSFRRGSQAKLDPQQAKDIDFLAPRLRAVIAACTVKVESQSPFDPKERIDAKRLRAILVQGQMTQLETVDNNELRLKATLKTWRQPAAVSTLNQLLMAENVDVRQVLVELLGQVDGNEATAALAQRAVFDPSPRVRKSAISQLQHRSRDAARPALLAGLRHPWLPANYHAAQALIALLDLDAIPAIEQLLEEPDPREPRRVEQNGEELYAVAEVVKVNHLKNCLMCHGPSLDERDVLRRAMPEKILDRLFVRLQNSSRRSISAPGQLDQINDVQMGWVSTGPEVAEKADRTTATYYANRSSIPELPGVQPINGVVARVFPVQPRIISSSDFFIEASKVFAQQDLSLQISNPFFTKEGIIANQDRFDYLVRLKPLTPEEYAERLMATTRNTRRHEATRYALDVLTHHQPPEVHARPLGYHPEGKVSPDSVVAGK